MSGPPFDPPQTGNPDAFGFIEVDQSHPVHQWFSQAVPKKLAEAGYDDLEVQVVRTYYDTNWPGWRFSYRFNKPMSQRAHLHMLALMYEASGNYLPNTFWQSAPDDEPEGK